MKNSKSKKPTALIILLLILAAAFLVFNNNGILKYIRIKSEINNLENGIKNSDDTLRILNKEIDSLKTSRFKIEKVAREKYRMKRKDEKVLKVDEN